MTPELFNAFKIELSALHQNLQRQRVELESINDGESAAVARQRITALEAHLSAVTTAQSQIIVAEMAVDTTVRKFITWRARVLAVREANAAVDAFVGPIENTQLRVDEAERTFQHAREARASLRPLDQADFLPQPTIRKYENQKRLLDAAVETRGSELRTLKQAIGELQRQFLEAQQRLERALFDERMARIPGAQQRDVGATLSGVA
jgi:hypothetical protein